MAATGQDQKIVQHPAIISFDTHTSDEARGAPQVSSDLGDNATASTAQIRRRNRASSAITLSPPKHELCERRSVLPDVTKELPLLPNVTKGLPLRTTATLTPPLGQFIVNSFLQLAGIVAAISFGVCAVESLSVAKQANIEAKIANQVSMLAICTQACPMPVFSTYLRLIFL